MSLVQLFTHPAGQLVTLALIHFLWQGLAIALVLIATVGLCRVRRATVRYALSLTAFFAMLLCPLGTLAWLSMNQDRSPESLTSAPGVMAPRSSEYVLGSFLPLTTAIPWERWLATAQPYALAAWLVGVTFLGSRLLTGIVGLSRVRKSREPIPASLQRLVERLGRRLQLNVHSTVFLSRQVADAMAVGLVRPLVLIPAAWVTELPMDVLEAVVAHELAHLRRLDLWVNFLQRIVESVLFYHPAVWWLSHRIRIERELCADELAVAITKQPLAYAQALEQVAHRRQAHVRPALAAFLRGETNMRLLERVHNVLGLSVSEHTRSWPAGLIAIVLPLGLWLLSIGIPAAIADDDRDDDDDKRSVAKSKFNADDDDDDDGDDDDGDDDDDDDDDKANAKRRLKVRVDDDDDDGDKDDAERTLGIKVRREGNDDDDDKPVIKKKPGAKPTEARDDDDDDEKPVVKNKPGAKPTEARDDDDEKPTAKKQMIELIENKLGIDNANGKKVIDPKQNTWPAKVVKEPGKEPVEPKKYSVTAKQSTEDQRVIHELAVAVKQLTVQVQKLEAEVAELRHGESRKGPEKVKESPDKNELEEKIIRKRAAVKEYAPDAKHPVKEKDAESYPAEFSKKNLLEGTAKKLLDAARTELEKELEANALQKAAKFKAKVIDNLEEAEDVKVYKRTAESDKEKTTDKVPEKETESPK